MSDQAASKCRENLTKLQTVISDNMKITAELANKLKPVLTPKLNKEFEAVKETKEENSPLAEELKICGDNVRKVNSELFTILQNLEL